MNANKIFYTNLETDEIFIVLRDAKIYTATTREEARQLNVYGGCFVDFRPCTTRENMFHTLLFGLDYDYDEVSLREFIEIEKEGDQTRVLKALKEVERIIAEG